MSSSRPKCTGCSRTIWGIIKIDTYKRKLGNKSLNIVDYYCENCFKGLKRERAMNEYSNKKATNKVKNNRRT